MSDIADLYRPKRHRSDRWKRRRFEAHFRDAEAAATTHLMFSHGHCLDGTGSVIVARRALGDGVGVLYLQPSRVQDALDLLRDVPADGRGLLIADLSLDPEHFDAIVASCAAIAANGWRIEWLDHHHKQWEGLELDRLREHVATLIVNDDATESGASLVQQHLAPKDAFARRLAATIRDRDLWWNKTPDSETLEFAQSWLGDDAFAAHYRSKKGRDKVVDAVIQDAADQQRALVEEHANILLSDVREHAASTGDKVAVVYGWLPKNVGLHRVLQRDGVRVAINVRPTGTMSLRSDPDWPVCQVVAKQFNGGGHPNASGAKLHMHRVAAWWYVRRRGRTAQVGAVVEAAVAAVEAQARGDAA